VEQGNTNRTIYCHFNFKRPKGESFGLFAVAFYSDFEGKKLIYNVTHKYPLWLDHQFVTAIQAYEHALYTIYVNQGLMRSAGIRTIMIVTDNSTLAGWIQDPKKNKKYTEYMDRAVSQYRAGASKEITIGIGLCEVRDYEKSYKYCKEEFVENDKADVIKKTDSGKMIIDIGASNLTYVTVGELDKQNLNKPEIVGM